MKTKEFLPQDLSKELKELGFKVPCLAWWFEDGTISAPTETRGFWSDWNVYPLRISAPLWQQATEWMRQTHKINVFVGYRLNTKKWDSHAYSLELDGKGYVKERTMKKFIEQDLFDEYYQALESGIREAITLIK